ncbi:hypothetical protein B6V76_13610 [Thioclava sp. IC9]|nr:hypothetical protein B6V76_13610 [Thioclava sp. IC9]
MGFRQKRHELVGLVGAIGVVIALAGFVGGYLSTGATIVLTFRSVDRRHDAGAGVHRFPRSRQVTTDTG